MYDSRAITHHSCKEYRALNYLYVNLSNYNSTVVTLFNIFDCKVDLIFDTVVVSIICVLITGIDLITHGPSHLCSVTLDL